MIPARRWLAWALLVGLVGGTLLVTLQQHVDKTLAVFHTEEQVLYLQSGEWVRRLSLGYDGLMACLYWTRAVQHYGRRHMARGEGGYPLLYPLLDITTTLDPALLLAYRFGAIFLTEHPPGGPGRPDLATELLRKGIRQNPDYWRFWYDVGFVYYRTGDYQKASDAFLEGSRHPDSLAWMRVMAARVAAEGGDRRKAQMLWTEVYNSTDDPAIRSNALNHLAGLQVDADVEFLEALLARFRERTGMPARSWQDLIAAGSLRIVPEDPSGLPYQLTAEGRVLLHPESPITTSTLGRVR